MKWILVFSVLFLTNCANQTNALVSENSANLNLNKIYSPTPTPTPSLINNSANQNDNFELCDDYEPIEIPKTNSAIGKIDFNNFSYPRIWEKGSIKLKNGCFGKEYTKPGLYFEEFTLNGIDFVDFDKDGKDEALIDMQNWSGGGSTGISENFYIYSLKGKKLNLIWKIATGTRAYCGIKEYEFKDKQITLELFGKCTLKPKGDFNDTGKHKYDYAAEEYTRFVFGWKVNKFAVISREEFPFPENDIKDYLNKKLE